VERAPVQRSALSTHVGRGVSLFLMVLILLFTLSRNHPVYSEDLRDTCRISSCYRCHELRGKHPRKTSSQWHRDHTGDYCEFCHLGWSNEQGIHNAHRDMISDPFAMGTVKCSQCHTPESLTIQEQYRLFYKERSESGPPSSPLLTNPDWLNRHLDDPNLFIIDVCLNNRYEAGHIPGATRIPVNRRTSFCDWPSREKFFETLRNLGINRNKKVVLYDDGDGLYTSSAFWVLKYYNFPEVSVLDGGMERWKAEWRPLSAQSFPSTPAPLMLSENRNILATPDYIKQRSQSSDFLVIDARSIREHRNLASCNDCAIIIPEAKNIFWKLNLRWEGRVPRWNSAARLLHLYQIEGATPEKEIVVYSCSGNQAAVSFFTLKLLGYENVRLVDIQNEELSSAALEETPPTFPIMQSIGK